MTTSPIWRQALNDSQHPFYALAWSLFKWGCDIEQIAQHFADEQEQIIPFLYAIVDERKLYHSGGVGGGAAPYQSIELLGHWHVADSIPRLITALAYTDTHFFDGLDGLLDILVKVLKRDFGATVVPYILEAIDAATIDTFSATEILGATGKGDERCHMVLNAIFDNATDPDKVEASATALLEQDYLASKPIVEQRLYQARNKSIRKKLKVVLEYAAEEFSE